MVCSIITPLRDILILETEIPIDPKGVTFDPFAHYPQNPLSDLPTDISPIYRRQLRRLLPWPTPNAIVADLAYAHRDDDGHLVADSYVANRPWEWIENLGEPSPPEDKEEKRRQHAQYLIKNSGSLSLDAFGAQATGDGVGVEGELGMFEDGLSAEGIYQRDWRETRIQVPLEQLFVGGAPGEEGPSSAASSPYVPMERRTPKGSPASTSLSHPTYQSPDQSRGRATGKRKVLSISDSDEIEIMDGPYIAPTKKAKGKAVDKHKGKKR
jgi:mediator of RNA polymerase II transcription subunit 12